MFDHKHYVPILKGKMGELSALKVLGETNKASLTPLIEIPPIPLKILKDKTRVRKTLDEHLDGFVLDIFRSWANQDRPLFLDTVWIQDDSIMSGGNHFLRYIFNDAHQIGLKLIPVTSFDHRNEFQVEVSKIISNDKNGVCLRLDYNALLREDFINQLDLLLSIFKIKASDIDLILDFRNVLDDQRTIIIKIVESVLSSLPYVNEWRTLTFACTSFPIDLSNISRNTVTLISRAEWKIWCELARNKNKLKRLPTFGDYGIAHPEIIDYDPLLMQTSASIRYTTDEEWLILKGASTKRYTFSQFINLSKLLIKRTEYCGSSFSWGDNYINDCANKKVTTGNLTTWRKVGTNHHLTFVTNRIANLSYI